MITLDMIYSVLLVCSIPLIVVSAMFILGLLIYPFTNKETRNWMIPKNKK